MNNSMIVRVNDRRLDVIKRFMKKYASKYEQMKSSLDCYKCVRDICYDITMEEYNFFNYEFNYMLVGMTIGACIAIDMAEYIAMEK